MSLSPTMYLHCPSLIEVRARPPWNGLVRLSHCHLQVFRRYQKSSPRLYIRWPLSFSGVILARYLRHDCRVLVGLVGCINRANSLLVEVAIQEQCRRTLDRVFAQTTAPCTRQLTASLQLREPWLFGGKVLSGQHGLSCGYHVWLVGEEVESLQKRVTDCTF